MLYGQSKKRRAAVRRIDLQATATTTQNGVMHNSVLSVGSKWIRATSDIRCETRKRGARSISGVTRSLPLPSGPISRHSYCDMRLSILFRVAISLASPKPRRRFSVPDCTSSIRTPPHSAPSRAPAITGLHSRVNSESQPCWSDWMDLPTSGADPSRFGRSADVILT